MKKLLFLPLVVYFLVSCGPTPEQISGPVNSTVAAISTATAYPTYTPIPPNPTYTPYPTYTIQPTYTPVILVVTATGTPTPEFTPTLTNTPEPTKDPTMTDKWDGFYLVGMDIAPGVWRSNGNNDNCYWAVTTKTGDILDNHFGMAGGTMYISTNGFQVELKHCGIWTYMGN